MLHIGGYLREPYPESIEKARMLLREHRITIARVGGKKIKPSRGFFVLGDAPRMLTIDCNDIFTHIRTIQTIIAVWIDQLPTSVRYIHAWYHYPTGKFFVDGASYHMELWEAEIESLTRERRLIYNCSTGNHFTP